MNVLDFAVTLDQRSVGVHLQDFLGERTVGTSLGGGGHHHGEVEKLSELGMSEDVLTVESGIPVTSNLVKANLEIEDQEKGVVLVEPFPRDGYELLV